MVGEAEAAEPVTLLIFGVAGSLQTRQQVVFRCDVPKLVLCPKFGKQRLTVIRIVSKSLLSHFHNLGGLVCAQVERGQQVECRAESWLERSCLLRMVDSFGQDGGIRGFA